MNVVNDQFHSSFVHYEIEEIYEAYINGISFCLVAFGNAIAMCSAFDNRIIYGRNSVDSQCQDLDRYLDNNIEKVLSKRQVTALSFISFAGNARSYSTPTTTRTLNVPYVSNAQVDGVGICWAASAASVVRYLRGGSVTAMEIYNRVSTVIASPTGTPDNILYGFRFYGINNYISQSDPISYLAMTRNIDAGWPLVLAMSGTSFSLPTAHGVVVCGYMSVNDGTSFLRVVDSNVSEGMVWITVDRNSNSFVYNAGVATTYTSWHWSVHCSTVA